MADNTTENAKPSTCAVRGAICLHEPRSDCPRSWPTNDAVTLTDAEHEALGQAFWYVRKHRIVGAYYPVGQMDGDCRECGEQWPCATVRPIFERLIERRLRDGGGSDD